MGNFAITLMLFGLMLSLGDIRNAIRDLTKAIEGQQSAGLEKGQEEE